MRQGCHAPNVTPPCGSSSVLKAIVAYDCPEMGSLTSARGIATRIAIAVALALGVTLLSGSATGEKAGETIRATLGGEAARLTMPTGDAKPKGVVVWFHGQGGNVNDRVDGPFLSGLLRDGWAIASSNFHAQSWGNPESSQDMVLLAKWIKDEVGVLPTLWVSGSMGGAVSLNAMLHGAPAPPCWYGVKPAIALTEMEEVPGGPGFIRTAFKGDVPADRNPVANIDKLPLTTRYRVVSSKQDQWVLYRENAGTLVQGLRARGGNVSELPATGLHDDPSHFNAQDLVKFADACLKASKKTSSAASD